MKKLSRICLIIAFLLTNVMCGVVAYNYRGMICGIEHAGFSAPAETAFLLAIPFALLVIVCVILAAVFNKKSEK